jgi:hypothetical protein
MLTHQTALGLLLLTFVPAALPAQSRWRIVQDGGITWEVEPGQAHKDQIEMSGRKVSLIVSYGVRQDGSPAPFERQIVFPTLRTIPNDTHASLQYTFGEDAAPRFFVNGRAVRAETATSIHLRGLLAVHSVLGPRKDVALTRAIFPSTTKPAVVETYTFRNTSGKPVTVEMEETKKTVRTLPQKGVTGAYVVSSRTLDDGLRTVPPGESATFSLLFSARQSDEPELAIDPPAEEAARRERVDGFLSNLILETPDPVLNTAFAFAKIRTTESVYETKGGMMHGPGGGAYYAAIWANDQAEYANPFFPFLGDAVANESAINSFRHFARYINPDYKPIPSSIVAEGTNFWNGAGDRGDMAMIAYGAARFALAYGDPKTAQELWPLIEWCLEYCRRKVNTQGVVASDSDELEGRFPAGKANLCTSSLYYDALNSALMLGRQLGKPAVLVSDYERRARDIREAIDNHFSANVAGFDTYRYYDGNTVLRAWICIPLTVGIYDRKSGTVDALFSPALWTPNGLATQAGDKTFWDRSTLYALRGVFAAGETQKAIDYLTYYSKLRLLGDHVPYPVEAWPEGNQRHLAAESALYCRVYTEGLFGIRPTGFHSFQITPRLPAGWAAMSLGRIHAFGLVFDVTVARTAGKLKVDTLSGGKVLASQTIEDGASATVLLESPK